MAPKRAVAKCCATCVYSKLWAMSFFCAKFDKPPVKHFGAWSAKDSKAARWRSGNRVKPTEVCEYWEPKPSIDAVDWADDA